MLLPGLVWVDTGTVRAAPTSAAGAGDPMRVGDEAYRRGDLEAASAAWLEAARHYSEAGEPGREAGALARAAEARGGLGEVRESHALLQRALVLATPTGDTRRIAAITGALARSYVELGAPERAEEALGQAALRAREAGDPGTEASIEYSRGDLRSDLDDPAGAARAFQKSETLAARSGRNELAAQAAASSARAWLEAGDAEPARAALTRADERAAALPDSDAKARAQLHAARTWERLADAGASKNADLQRAARAYGRSITAAESAGALRTASFALGYLGALHARSGPSDEAVQLTRRAASAARQAEAPESTYRWQWQLGRLLRQRGDTAGSLAALRGSVETLDALRAATGGRGLDFAADVESVYFDLVDLLLVEAAAPGEEERRQALLREARDRLEALKSAELRDYFQDSCLAPQREIEAETLPGASVVYPVVLSDRTELIVSREGRLASVVVPVKGEELDREVRTFRSLLQKRTTREYRPYAARLYDWLIRPLEAELGDTGSDALVFVPGGSLRTIPMAALYDRESRQFLIEKYPLAVIPALTLIDPRALDRTGVRTLMAGLTLSVQGYPALEAVDSELDAVGTVFQGEELVDDQFVVEALEESLAREEYGIVHIATHGEFRGESSESFILTYDGRLDLERLGVLVERRRFRDQPIELLTLSACETAAGDSRAALGLAGIAVRAGARSALATLWTVNDQAAADLIGEFYRQLAEPGVSKAEALRRAQMSLLEARPYRHPGYWSPFLLISNWM